MDNLWTILELWTIIHSYGQLSIAWTIVHRVLWTIVHGPLWTIVHTMDNCPSSMSTKYTKCSAAPSLAQVCGDGLLKDGCMTEDTLAKQKDKQVRTGSRVHYCAGERQPAEGEGAGGVLGLDQVPCGQVPSPTSSWNLWSGANTWIQSDSLALLG